MPVAESKSQIYGGGYEAWKGERVPDLPTWLLIGKASVQNMLASSGCLSKLVLLIFLVYVVGYYLLISLVTFSRHQVEALSRMERLSALEPVIRELASVTEAALHRTMILWPSLIFCILAMLVYGAQLISKDKAHNALQVYFSKAVSHVDYLVGKFFAIGVVVALVTLVPSALMIALGLVLTPDKMAFIADAWPVPIMTGVYWLVLTLGLGTFTLFFSSCFNKFYMAAISFVGFLMFSSVVSFLIRQLIGLKYMVSGFSWFISFLNIGKCIYTLDVGSWPTLTWQVIDLILVCGIFIWYLFRNIRPVEVVS